MKKLKSNKTTTTKNTYNELYNLLYSSLCVFSNKYVNNLEKSKDIVQEVFVKLWNHKILLEKEEAIKAYLYTSVRNKSLDYLKSKEYRVKNSASNIDLTHLKSETYFEKEVLIEEVSRLVDKALQTLPDKCRGIVELSMKGHQNHEIAEELKISVNTVKSQKKIAYKKLRPLLKDSYAFLLLMLLS
ncbi:RNA polymerase sigma-70 factor (ECF subfamily) [Wenyingzhuangia heitensis]|uniref:RNA polymerase sigma-70 factor (ECF subfamily) n=1 Tax=Wenyingzhuangia heitensis TaxID=1487859 RepID=A0ABX0U562_9FLAO|nr:RNA polymerase sigma-70 factor [Wenyingzhuangia heitensis]NIJ43898.1 RNA polymerase sigma-70 factor (ECF subfamily) [Wenyingzhuangia heitensis]